MKTLCVRTSSLGVLGEAPDEMTPPAPGDMVNFEGQGKVSRVEGDMAYIDVESVNGEPLPEDMEEKPMSEEESMAQEEAELDRMAREEM